jgi:hypothetical protein
VLGFTRPTKAIQRPNDRLELPARGVTFRQAFSVSHQFWQTICVDFYRYGVPGVCRLWTFIDRPPSLRVHSILVADACSINPNAKVNNNAAALILIAINRLNIQQLEIDAMSIL